MGSKVPDLDFGNTEIDESAIIEEVEDGREPVELLARIFAHIGHRVPGVKRVEKKLEGQDKSSGFFSDLLALVTQLYRRNETTIQAAVTAGVEQYKVTKAMREAAAAAAAAETNGATASTEKPSPENQTRPPERGVQ